MPDYLDLFREDKPRVAAVLTREERKRAEVRAARKARSRMKAIARSRRNSAAREATRKAERRLKHLRRPSA